MSASYYSVRMHASRDFKHLSGAERLVSADAVNTVSAELLERAQRHAPDIIRLKVEEVACDQIVYGPIPDVTLMPQAPFLQGREQAVSSLVEAGVSEQSAAAAIALIAAGAAAGGGVMRGAMLINAQTGERLEPDRDRGVRATHLDLTPAVADSLAALLQKHGLQHIRTREALTLAAKVLAAPGVIAELCWSDAPDYTAGYVSSAQTGYRRISSLKEIGDPLGGRAFFMKSGFNLDQTIAFLEQTPFLADRHGVVTIGSAD